MINIRLYHVKAFKKEGGCFIFSCHNNDDLEGITLTPANVFGMLSLSLLRK